MDKQTELYKQLISGVWKNENIIYNFHEMANEKLVSTVDEIDAKTGGSSVLRQYALYRSGNDFILEIANFRYRIIKMTEKELTIESISPIDTFVGQEVTLFKNN